MCFTNNSDNPAYWNNYACSDTGVALEFKFEKFHANYAYSYDFRDVFYDDGYDFDFITYINYHLIKEFNLELFINGLHAFSKFYKRGRYKWEKETRLCIDYSHPMSRVLEKELPIKIDPRRPERKYVELPLIGNANTNPICDITIDKVICGKNISKEHYLKLGESLLETFPNAELRRKT